MESCPQCVQQVLGAANMLSCMQKRRRMIRFQHSLLRTWVCPDASIAEWDVEGP